METNNPFIYGRNPTEGIVCVEPQDGFCVIFTQQPDGTVTKTRDHNSFWALAPQQYNSCWSPLDGPNHFKYRRYFPSRDSLYQARQEHRDQLYVVHDPKESYLINSSSTYYKGLRIQDVGILAFDIEATTLDPDHPDSRVLLISNTFRLGTKVVRKLFACDDYATDKEMFNDWCQWVRDQNPSIIVGHNIYGYDLPYLHTCAHRAGTKLCLGRDEGYRGNLWFNGYDSKYRRDGSQFYNYRNAHIYGREIVDTFFLAMKYDVGRKYDNFRLKYIVAAEGLEVAGRQHYDASQIAKNWQDATERAKIKAYAEHDADDALSLFDRMAASFFYLNQAIPKSFQHIINSASGSWLNSFLVRSYLQEGFSIPKESEGVPFEGAISIGNPGIYRDVFKVDVASLYPSIMLQYGIHDEAKDPRGHFQKMVSHFTAERLANKRRAKETGDRYYSDLEQSQKIVINSAYGMLGAPGLNFNSPTNAARVTTEGRRILTVAMEYAERNAYELVNADTDSISISSGHSWPDSLKSEFLMQLNDLSPNRIRWEDDGTYDCVVVLKAKNYVLKQGTKTKIKGSALKATLKEPALQQLIRDVVESLTATEAGSGIEGARVYYENAAREIMAIRDIKRWATKKTVTEKVLNPSRTLETNVLAALEGTEVQQGDKVHLYFDLNEKPKLASEWNHDHHIGRLLRKLFDTISVFDTVLDLSLFPNYALKRNKAKLLELIKPASI